jgi:hypothetical protein
VNADSHSSVSQWIAGAKAGDSEAVRRLWERYFGQLVTLARKKLAGREDLWRLLLTLTAQKAVDQRRRASRAKRGGGRVFLAS